MPEPETESELELELSDDDAFDLELEAEVAVASASSVAAVVAADADAEAIALRIAAAAEGDAAAHFAESAASAIDSAFAAMLHSPAGSSGSPKGSLPWPDEPTGLRREELLAWLQGMQGDKDELLGESLGASERAKKEILLQAYAEIASSELSEEAVPPLRVAVGPPAADLPRALDRRISPANVTIDAAGLRACASEGPFPALLRSTTPFSLEADGQVAYYEVTVVNGGTMNIVGVGLVSAHQKPRRQPGWDRGAFGYHSDDGYLYAQQPSEQSVSQKAETYSTGDVVGCGVVFSRAAQLPIALFWTKNGVLLDLQVNLVSQQQIAGTEDQASFGNYFAGIGLDKDGTEVAVNFGTEPFVFDVASALAEGALPSPDDRLWRYHCLGNMMGLCLLHGGEQYDLRFPLYFSRHVYKFLLRRRVEFADYAYHDPEGHANLLKIIADAELILQGKPVVEPNGAKRLVEPDEDYWLLEWDDSVGVQESGCAVTAENAHAYVEQMAMHEMVGSVRSELTAIRDGMFDVITEEDVRALTPDDLQLLLSGKPSQRF